MTATQAPLPKCGKHGDQEQLNYYNHINNINMATKATNGLGL
jgi:hypothetical protein